MATFSQTITGDRDGNAHNASYWSSSTTAHYIGKNAGGNSYSIYLQWSNVTIQKNATISAASITMKAFSTKSTATISSNISCAAEDNATFPTSSADAVGRTPTSAVVAWNGFSTTNGSTNTTPDLASVFQEIVNRSGWASGNAALSMIRDNASSTNLTRDFYSANAGAGNEPTISITYTNPTPAPTVTDCSPATGSTAGGTSVTLTGTDFTGATGVTFGGDAATSVVVVNSTTITCVTPAHAAGAVDVVVTTSAGSGTLTNGFTYSAPAAAGSFFKRNALLS